jgi:TPR repeat protein
LIKEDVQPLLDAAEAGFPDAQYHLGELYRVGDKDLAISPDVKLAEKYLRMAFAKHHPRAAYSLGQMMESQSTFFVNKEADAILMYEIASEGGVEPAALRLGEIHEAHSQSLFSSAQNTRYAITSYEIAAKSEVIQIRDKALAALKKLRPLSLTELGNASKNLPEVPQ